jgi:anti-sigma B factor antagonist
MGPSEEFAYTVTLLGERATVEVRGDLDAASGPALADAVTALTNDGLAQVVIDLHDVAFVDSRGLSSLLVSHQTASDKNIALSVINLHPTVARLFRITGVDALLLDHRQSA